MKHKLKNSLIRLTQSSVAFTACCPQAYCEDPHSLPYIIKIINVLLGVFRGAGLILLAYSVIALILAVKDENVDAKVQASTQIAVALVCITLSSIIRTLGNAADVNLNVK